MLGRGNDLPGALLDVVVILEGEWRRFAGPMARRAVLKNDGCDVPVERQGTLGCFNLGDGGERTPCGRDAYRQPFDYSTVMTARL
jgi:hypothetical protein